MDTNTNGIIIKEWLTNIKAYCMLSNNLIEMEHMLFKHTILNVAWEVLTALL